MASRIFTKSYDTIFATCIDALQDLDIDISAQNKRAGIIHGETGTSLLSWGEEIKIKIQVAGNRTKVIVKSEASAQLFSWGKNSSNEETILDKIEELL